MKVNVYNQIVAAQLSRRAMLKGAASLGVMATASGLGLGAMTLKAMAEDSVRA